MLNKDEFKKGMEKLVMAFPNWRFEKSDPEVMKFWYGKFSRLQDSTFARMVDSYIEKEELPPTVAGLYKKGSYQLGELP